MLRKAWVMGLALTTALTANAVEPWRERALNVLVRLGDRIEVLDETMHEVYEKHSTPEFKTAIEDMHHIEDVVNHFKAIILTADMDLLCGEINHLYEDLTQIRLDLIALGIQKHQKVVKSWNHMVYLYNSELNPYFRGCGKKHPHPHWSMGSELLPL